MKPDVDTTTALAQSAGHGKTGSGWGRPGRGGTLDRSNSNESDVDGNER